MLSEIRCFACAIVIIAYVLTGCTSETSLPAELLNPEVDVTITPADAALGDLNALISSYQENTRFLIKAGTYRMQFIKPRKGMVFYGEVDAAGNRHTILNGSRLLSGFVESNNLYYVTGQDQEGVTQGITEPGWEGSVHPEDLFFDDVALRQVLSKPEVATGTWYFDYANDTIWLADDPTGHKVEVSVTPYAFYENLSTVTGSEVAIKGFIVEKYANPSQTGAIGGDGANENWHVEFNELRLNHGAGVVVGANSRVMYNHSHHNGHLGMKVRGNSTLVQGNELSYNNTQHFDVNWESGGAKVGAIDGLIVKDNYVHHNYGRGLWVDIGSHNVEIHNNLITHNNNEGVLYEISDTGTITNNRLGHNGKVGDWLYGGNIVISSSADVEVSGNTVVTNSQYGNGITVLWTDRHLSFAKLGHTPPLRVENINVHHNDITYMGILNTNSGKEPMTGASAATGVDEYDASGTINNIPPVATVVVSDVDITDPRLNNSFDYNAYHAVNLSKKYFRWGRSASRISWDEFRLAGNEMNGTYDGAASDKAAAWLWSSGIDAQSYLTEVLW